MNFEEFRDSVQKKKSQKKFKVKNSFGVYDIFKILRKNKWESIGQPLKEHIFYTIIREINNLLAIELGRGETIVLPARMGRLELRKKSQGVSIVNNYLENTYPINWNNTIRLWFDNAIAKAKRTLLRDEDKVGYFIKYCKYCANYENKSFYQFTLNRFIKRALKENIKRGKIDTLW